MADRKFTTFKVDNYGRTVNRVKDAPQIDWYTKFEEKEIVRQKTKEKELRQANDELIQREKEKLKEMVQREKENILKRKEFEMERERRIIEARKKEEEKRRAEEERARAFGEQFDSITSQETKEKRVISPNPRVLEQTERATEKEPRYEDDNSYDQHFTERPHIGVIKRSEQKTPREQTVVRPRTAIIGLSEKSSEEFETTADSYSPESERLLKEKELELERLRAERLRREQEIEEELVRERERQNILQTEELRRDEEPEEILNETETKDERYMKAIDKLKVNDQVHRKQIQKVDVKEYLEQISPEAEKALHNSPFLYTGVYPEIRTIEQFYLPNSYDTFGGLFRSGLKKRKKQKAIRETFEEWKLGFEKEKTKAMSDSDLKLNLTDNVSFPKFKFYHLIIIGLLTLIGMFFLLLPGAWGLMIRGEPSGTRYGEKLARNLDSFFNSIGGQVFAYIFLILLFVVFLYIRYHNIVIRDYEDLMKDTRNYYSTGTQRLQREFRENYHKTLKYYLKNAKRPLNTRAYNIMDVIPKTSSLEEIDDVTSQAVIKTSDMKNKQKKFKILHVGNLVLGYLLVISLYTILIIKLIQSIKG